MITNDLCCWLKQNWQKQACRRFIYLHLVTLVPFHGYPNCFTFDPFRLVNAVLPPWVQVRAAKSAICSISHVSSNTLTMMIMKTYWITNWVIIKLLATLLLASRYYYLTITFYYTSLLSSTYYYLTTLYIYIYSSQVTVWNSLGRGGPAEDRRVPEANIGFRPCSSFTRPGVQFFLAISRGIRGDEFISV